MAHRGGSLEFVENTLPAFRHAANELKVDLLELDCQLTSDGHAVIFHDNTLERMCGLANKKISDFTLEGLPRLKIPESLADKPHVTEDPDSTRIPRLEELLMEFPNYPMQIDVKDGPEELVFKVGELIKKYKREQQTVWGSFRKPVGNLCYQHFPEIPLFFDVRNMLLSYFAWAFGLWGVYARYYKPRYSCLIMPDVWPFVQKGWFSRLNELGIPVILFGVPNGSIHTTEGYLKARAAGVNGICTDKPSLLKEFLLSNSLFTLNGQKKIN
jgi:glycerophosphoryl diester phosphodiesterase